MIIQNVYSKIKYLLLDIIITYILLDKVEKH
jgi:hypothetical protein